jgi:hypothetical protein
LRRPEWGPPAPCQDSAAGGRPRHPGGGAPANILAYRIARSVNATSRRAARLAAPVRNEVASIHIDVLMVLPTVCPLAQHEGDHRREADQADHNHCEHAHHPTAQSIKPRHDTNAQFRGGQPPLTTVLLRAAGIIARLGSGRTCAVALVDSVAVGGRAAPSLHQSHVRAWAVTSGPARPTAAGSMLTR